MRLHVYAAGGGEARTSEVEPEVRVREVVVVEAGDLVYVLGEQVEIDLDRRFGEVFGDGPGHVVVHPCRRVTVTVSYGGAEAQVQVAPSVPLRVVRLEAIQRLGISRADAADLVLRLPGADADLSLASPVGSIVVRGGCVVTVDLVPTVRPQG